MSNNVIMCEKKPELEAKWRARWEWGENVHVSDEGRAELEQLAGNLGRRVEFSELTPGQSPPVERAERVAYKSQIFALEEEIVELRGKCASLYAELTTTRADHRLMLIKSSAAETAVKSSNDERDKANAAALALTRENTLLKDEVSTLRAVLGDVEKQTAELEAAKAELKKTTEASVAPVVEPPAS